MVRSALLHSFLYWSRSGFHNVVDFKVSMKIRKRWPLTSCTSTAYAHCGFCVQFVERSVKPDLHECGKCMCLVGCSADTTRLMPNNGFGKRCQHLTKAVSDKVRSTYQLVQGLPTDYRGCFSFTEVGNHKNFLVVVFIYFFYLMIRSLGHLLDTITNAFRSIVRGFEDDNSHVPFWMVSVFNRGIRHFCKSRSFANHFDLHQNSGIIWSGLSHPPADPSIEQLRAEYAVVMFRSRPARSKWYSLAG